MIGRIIIIKKIYKKKRGGGGGGGERERKREKGKKYCPGLECFDFKFPPQLGKSCGALTAESQGRQHGILGEVRETTSRAQGR